MGMMGELEYGTTEYRLPRKMRRALRKLTRRPLRVRVWRRVRGAYGRSVTVTARRWWSRGDRRAARTAAALMDYQAAEVRKRITRLLIYGYSE
jgi:hypothetical protein